MTAQELKETGQRLFKAGQYSDAIPLLKSAAEAFPKDESLWQELVLAAHHAGQNEQAVDFAKQAIRQHPSSGWLWRQLGSELTTADRLDEAEKAFSNALSFLGPSDEWLWRYLAALHRKQKNFEREIEALENLCELGEANSNDIWQLGNTYYERENYAKAIESYRYQAILSPDPNPFFNMGLAFNKPEVSQDANAADAYRRALFLNPNFNKAREQLEVTKQKLVPLAVKARDTTSGLVQPNEHFQFYVSPFEVLQIEAVELVEELDVKVIQRAKKQLLQEIELNDGKVSWMDDYSLDKARALGIVDELDDTAKKRYHWAVFQNKRLLGFLTRGDIRHFLYADDYFPHETLELLDEEPEFRLFLSKPFARQYNFVLTRAVERRLLPIVEVMFNGRRWVEPEDEDICFEGAFKRIGDLVELMRSKAAEGCARKVSLQEIEDFLRQHSFPELFNLLPTTFASAQKEVVAEIRSLAISCFNEHDDADLSKGVLSLCKRFTSRSVELTKRLEEDFKAIERMIAEEQKHSFSAWVRSNAAVQIRKGMIAYGGATMNVADIEAIRWGIFVRTVNGVESEHSFSLTVSDARSGLYVGWEKRGIFAGAKTLFRKPGKVVPIAELSSAEQEVYFQQMIDAAIHHLVPSLISKIVGRLEANQSVVIGPCTLSREGIAFRTGLVFRKEHHLPWRDAETQMQSGQIFVLSRTNRKAQVSMPAKDTDNAVILPILCAEMREHTTSEQEQSQPEVTEQQRNQKSYNKSNLWWLVIPAIFIILWVINSFDSTKTAPSDDSYTPPSPYRPSAPGTSTSESKTVYRVPSYTSSELESDRKAIEVEEAKAERMASELESLDREIERDRLYLDQSSQFKIDAFNRKVNNYNGLVEKAREQNRLVNQMIKSYNEKLQKYGR